MNYPIDSLIKKFLTGDSNEQEDLLLEHYLSENPIPNINITQTEKSKIDLSIRNKLGIQKRATIKKSFYNILSITAAIFLICGIYIFYFQNHYIKLSETKFISKTENRDGIEVKNTSKIARIITLEDGSTVLLEPSSYITFPEHFMKKSRQVHLFGDALFNVISNPEKPFIVYTENIVTQVIGTSFRIKSLDKNDIIEVSVLKGKVSVYENKNDRERYRNGIILTPNQKVTFKKQSQKMDIGIIPEPVIIDQQLVYDFNFNDQPISNVLQTLQAAYGIEIVLENSTINQCTFTGDLSELTMALKLELLCKSIQANFERRGASIFISGNGCK